MGGGRHEERMQKVKGCHKVREQIERRGGRDGNERQRAGEHADRKEGDGEGKVGKWESEGAMQLWIIQNQLKGGRSGRRGESGSGSH